ncbi:MAG: zinc carboxypeptidase, partial [Bacteroidetes bacterium]
MRIRLTLLLVTISLAQLLSAQNLAYYLPANTTYNTAIPTPASIIGHEVGEWHVTHDKLVQYIKALNVAAPAQSVLQNLGTTYEGRQQLALIVSSPKNIARLEEIRTQHLAFSKTGNAPNQKLPVVVWMGFSIHGNESSGSNASMLTAYHLLAANDAALKNMLENTIVIIDPSFNPDGLNRFASWVNSHRNTGVLNPDPQSREYSEVWPGGRFNHYWFDLNRDWLPAQHVESKNRLALYQQWLPHILTDHHEQGSNATYFFQPGVPSRTNPNTPLQNQQLTAEIATYHAKKLDSIKTLYFTKEGYDDFYYGKGSTYPDINGGIGILFEQASSRGHVQETDNGLLSFPFTIKNQFITTLSTLEAASKMQEKLTNYQRSFFEQAQKEATEYATKSFVFGSEQTQEETRLFVELLLRHSIDVYPITKNIQLDGKTFLPGHSFTVPTNQTQFKLIKTIFEKNTQYKDSLFYDVTAWT